MNLYFRILNGLPFMAIGAAVGVCVLLGAAPAHAADGKSFFSLFSGNKSEDKAEKPADTAGDKLKQNPQDHMLSEKSKADAAAAAAQADKAVIDAAHATYHGKGIIVSDAFLEEGDNCVSMTLTSKTQGIDAVMGAATPVAGKVVLIDQRMHKDVPKIEMMPDVPLKIARGTVCLILRDMKTPPKAGEKFQITLKFDRAPSVIAQVKVVAQAASSEPAPPPVTVKSESVKSEPVKTDKMKQPDDSKE